MNEAAPFKARMTAAVVASGLFGLALLVSLIAAPKTLAASSKAGPLILLVSLPLDAAGVWVPWVVARRNLTANPLSPLVSGILVYALGALAVGLFFSFTMGGGDFDREPYHVALLWPILPYAYGHCALGTGPYFCH